MNRRLSVLLATIALTTAACRERPQDAPDSGAVARPAPSEPEGTTRTATSAPAARAREPLPMLEGHIVLEASCGSKAHPCLSGEDIAVRLASTTVGGQLYVFVVEDPGRSIFTGPLAVNAGEPLILPVALMTDEVGEAIQLEGVVVPRPFAPEEIDRLRGGEPLRGAVGHLEIPIQRTNQR